MTIETLRKSPKPDPIHVPLFYQEDRLAIFVDGSGLYSMAASIGKKVDFKALVNHCSDMSRLVSASYYTCTSADENGFIPLQGVLDFLEYNGWNVIAKPSRQYTDTKTGATRHKGIISIDIAVDMISQAKNFDHILLFTGDGDQARTVQALQREGVRVTVCGTLGGEIAMVSDDLRRSANRFVDIAMYPFGKGIIEQEGKQ